MDVRVDHRSKTVVVTLTEQEAADVGQLICDGLPWQDLGQRDGIALLDAAVELERARQ